MNLVIDGEFRKIIFPLQPEEFTSLEDSLLQEGCRDALVVWEGQNILLDGHHRYDLCSRHNIPFKTISKQFESRNDAKTWIIQNQFSRRNINLYQRSVLALALEEIFAEKAKERQSLGGKIKVVQNSSQAGKTRENLASVAHVSHDTIAKYSKVSPALGRGEVSAR